MSVWGVVVKNEIDCISQVERGEFNDVSNQLFALNCKHSTGLYLSLTEDLVFVSSNPNHTV